VAHLFYTAFQISVIRPAGNGKRLEYWTVKFAIFFAGHTDCEQGAERLDNVKCAVIMWLVLHSQHEWKGSSGTIQHKVRMRCIM
jgi:hypothetical protein